MLISRGCPWASMKRGGCKFIGSKTGAVLCTKKGWGCSFAVVTQAQRVSAPCLRGAQKAGGWVLERKGYTNYRVPTNFADIFSMNFS